MQVAPYSLLYEDPMQKLPPLASAARSSSWQTGMGGDGSPTIKAGPRSMHNHSCSGSLNSSFPPGHQSLMDSFPLSAISLSSAPSSSLFPSPPVKQGSMGAAELSHLSSLGLYEQQQQQQLADAQALLMAQQVMPQLPSACTDTQMDCISPGPWPAGGWSGHTLNQAPPTPWSSP